MVALRLIYTVENILLNLHKKQLWLPEIHCENMMTLFQEYWCRYILQLTTVYFIKWDDALIYLSIQNRLFFTFKMFW